jgi:UDP-N-acetylglucosamine--N-acetylmuramyl-(pentapeptide) pyrophosphoryl-undecaprenol N-acetylglucosamine transferase
MRKPLVVHEQNAVAGLTNKYLAKIASRSLTGFPNVEGMPADAQWVGNPVREEIAQAKANDSPGLRVLVIGGSQGAHSFNTKLPAAFAQINHDALELWHQSGRDQGAAVQQRYRDAGMTAKVTEFIDDMASAYQWCDLLVCRAGAMTIAECCAAGKPALLLPYPFSAGDHQAKNAQAMVEAGAAYVLDNHQIDQPIMVSQLTKLMSDKTELKKMGNRARKLHKPNALRDVVGTCQEFLDA